MKSPTKVIIHVSHNSIEISDIINNQRVRQRYVGYSLQEAKIKFRQYVKELEQSEQL